MVTEMVIMGYLNKITITPCMSQLGWPALVCAVPRALSSISTRVWYLQTPGSPKSLRNLL